ncbi:MAG: hypothetical protein VKJ66_00330 [Synechococcus sp.]|nr:hypothetical protein [Synechococcus sp.]
MPPPSKRFLTPSELASRWPQRAWGARECFPEGLWSALQAQLEREGWNPSQIEKIHGQLRQGWPLAMACQNVSLFTGHCPINARRTGSAAAESEPQEALPASQPPGEG